MPTERKIQQVAELEERLSRCQIAISFDYRGLSVGEMQQLRRTLREIEPTTEMRVVKNTMLKRAAENSGTSVLMEVVEEATALVFGYEDEVSAAKGLEKFARDRRIDLAIRGGMLDGAVVNRAQIDELAKVPSRLELMAKLAGGLSSPVTGIAGSINSLMREIAAIIEARAVQLEAEGGDAGSPAGEADDASSEGGDDEADAEEASSEE